MISFSSINNLEAQLLKKRVQAATKEVVNEKNSMIVIDIPKLEKTIAINEYQVMSLGLYMTN